MVVRRVRVVMVLHVGQEARPKTKNKKSHKAEKNLKGDALVSYGFANARKSFWMKQGLEPATAGFPLNQLTSTKMCSPKKEVFLLRFKLPKRFVLTEFLLTKTTFEYFVGTLSWVFDAN